MILPYMVIVKKYSDKRERPFSDNRTEICNHCARQKKGVRPCSL